MKEINEAAEQSANKASGITREYHIRIFKEGCEYAKERLQPTVFSVNFADWLKRNYSKSNDGLWYDGNAKDGFVKYSSLELLKIYVNQL